MSTKEKREKYGRAFKLTERQANELFLNTSPEKIAFDGKLVLAAKSKDDDEEDPELALEGAAA